MNLTTPADRTGVTAGLVRSFDFTECEFRDDGPNGWVTFEGVASVVDAPYQVRDQLGTFSETIRAGAFDKTLGELKNRARKGPQADVALYINHDYRSLPLATVSSGNLEVWASPHLNIRSFLNPARPSVQEARHAVSDGQARQMSVGFSVPKGKDTWNAAYDERSIAEVMLSEASIVWRGANHMTTGAVRAIDELLDTFRVGGEYDEAEVRRTIKHLESLLPASVVTLDEARTDDDEAAAREAAAEHLRMLRQMWDAKGRPPAA